MKQTDWLLDPEEKAILEAYEKGELVSVMKPGDREKYASIAKAGIKQRKKSVNIRLDHQDIIKTKKIAAHEGLGYQTLLGSVIHKWVNAPGNRAVWQEE